MEVRSGETSAKVGGKVDRQRLGISKGMVLKIGITWLCIILLAVFFIAMKSGDDPITMSILPEVPRENEPIVVTFDLSNATDLLTTTSYQLYVNGRLVETGSATITPQSSTRHQYAYKNSLKRGEQVNFLLKTSSETGNSVEAISLPAYPPQLMSSFVSFAAFSTSVMSSMISMEYFTNTFGTNEGINTGIIISAILIILMVFLELAQARPVSSRISILDRYKFNFNNLATILFIVFIGIVFTRIVMIISTG